MYMSYHYLINLQFIIHKKGKKGLEPDGPCLALACIQISGNKTGPLEITTILNGRSSKAELTARYLILKSPENSTKMQQ